MIYLTRAFLPFWCVVAGASYGAMCWISTQHPSADTEIQAAYQELEGLEVEKSRLEADATAHKEFDEWLNDGLEKIAQDLTDFKVNETAALKKAKRNNAAAIAAGLAPPEPVQLHGPEAGRNPFGQPDPVAQEFRRRIPSAYDARREDLQRTKPAPLPVDSLNGQELAMIEAKTATLKKELTEDFTAEAAKKAASLPSDPDALLAKNKTRTNELENLIRAKWKLEPYHTALWKAALGLFFAAFIGVCASDLALASGGGFHRILIRKAGWIITAFLCLSLAIAFWFLYRNGPFVELATIGKWSLGYLGGFLLLIFVSEVLNDELRVAAAEQERANRDRIARQEEESRRAQAEQRRIAAEQQLQLDQRKRELIAKIQSQGQAFKADPHRYVSYRNELVSLRLLNGDHLQPDEFPIDDLICTVDHWRSTMEQSSDYDAVNTELNERKWFNSLHWLIQRAAAKGRLMQLYDQVADIVSAQLPRETFQRLLVDIGAKTDPDREKSEFKNLEEMLAKLCEKNRDRWQKVAEQETASRYFDLFEATNSHEQQSVSPSSSDGKARKSIEGNLSRTVDA